MDPMKKLVTPPHLLPTRACKSKVFEINDVSSGDNSDNFENEDEEEETTSSPQEVDVHTIVENGVPVGVNGHDITPPFLLTKLLILFRKGEANAHAPTKIDPPKLTSTQENTTLVLMNNHTNTTNGIKHSLHKGVSIVAHQIVIKHMHTMALVLKTQKNVSVVET